MIIYKLLFKKRDLCTCDESIVYSTLIGMSLMNTSECFDGDGTFSLECVDNYISFCHDMYNRYYIELTDIPIYKMSKMTGVSRRQMYNILANLRKKRLIVDDTIFCPPKLLCDGFLKLPENTGLRGWQLVFYAFIKELSKNYNGSIDTWSSKLAEYFSTSSTAIKSLIRELTKKGYVKRMPNGKLWVK